MPRIEDVANLFGVIGITNEITSCQSLTASERR